MYGKGSSEMSSFGTSYMMIWEYLILISSRSPSPVDIFGNIPVVNYRHNMRYLISSSSPSLPPFLPYRYFSSLLWLEPLSPLLRTPLPRLCSTAMLRVQNVALTIATFLLLHWLISRTNKTHGSFGE